jgi:Flp pilus assembly CpaF family ATPase
MRIATTPKGKRTLANSELAQAALRERLKRVIVSEKK